MPIKEKAARGELAPYLGQEVRCALVEASLHSLAGNLPPELVEELVRSGMWQPRQALTYVRQMPDGWHRAKALAGLASRLAALPRPALYPLWDETLQVLARRTRVDLLADLRALEPIIVTLGGVKAVAETFRAIQDVGRWWP